MLNSAHLNIIRLFDPALMDSATKLDSRKRNSYLFISNCNPGKSLALKTDEVGTTETSWCPKPDEERLEFTCVPEL